MRVVAYTRISEDPEGLALGVRRQEEDCRALAQRRGWEVAGVRQDNDVSAFNTKVIRPEFEALLEDLRQGAVDGVVVYDLDRFARQPADLERAIRIFEMRPDLVFATVQQDFDLSSADGLTMARVMIAFANKASMDTSRRTKRKHLELAQGGVPVGSRRPFGYDDDRVTVREPEAELIRQAAADVLAGIGTHAIARRWNAQGVKTPYGNIWRQSPLKRMLVSPRLPGYRVYHGEIAHDSEGNPIMAQRAPLLNLETWEAMCAVLQDPVKNSKSVHPGGRKNLLAGLVRCGLCSVPMQSDRNARERIHIYVCKQPTSNGGCGKVMVSGPRVDELITELVLRYLSDQEVQQVAEPWPGEDALLDVTARIAELMSAYTKSELTGAVVFPAVGSLEGQATTLRDEKGAWLRKQASVMSRPTNVEATWPTLETDRRRAVIESVIQTVIIKPAQKKGGRFSPDRVEVAWR